MTGIDRALRDIVAADPQAVWPIFLRDVERRVLDHAAIAAGHRLAQTRARLADEADRADQRAMMRLVWATAAGVIMGGAVVVACVKMGVL